MSDPTPPPGQYLSVAANKAAHGPQDVTLYPEDLLAAAQIIRRYEGMFAYPRLLAEHLERVADQMAALRQPERTQESA